MTTYGVTPTGFVIKPLAVILDEIEQQLVTEFGPGVIQTPQSPLGQINGLFADQIAQMWEAAEDIYQSYDPDQAEGTRLDTLGRLRLVSRGEGEDDPRFRLAITNEGTARVTLADLARAVQNVDGVRFRQVFVNETSTTDENQMPPNTVAVAALGGEDMEVAAAINRFVPPGISTHGNVALSTIEDGFCRTIRMIRPVETGVDLEISVRMSATRRGCPAPSPTAVGNALLVYLTNADTRPWNGQAINAYLIRSFVEAEFDGVEFVSLSGLKEEFPERFQSEVPFAFFEIAEVRSISITVINQ